MSTGNWLIYGATGYSGQLLAEAAVARQLSPILASRDGSKLQSVANRLGLEFRTFSLDDPDNLAQQLEGIDWVLNCAGPFSFTSAPMIQACLSSGCHYFDISGEIDVFEHAHSASINRAAQEKGIIICPGVGFDVIPTDCIAKTLVEAMPDACELALGFTGFDSFSPGTAKTMVEGMAKPTLQRVEGKIVTCPLDIRPIDYGQGPIQAMPISWGDISTAYYSTGIGNIKTYIPATNSMLRQVRIASRLRPLLKLKPVQRLLKALLGKLIKGPNQQQRDDQRVGIWGEVRNSQGDTISARIETINGYQLTTEGALASVAFMLDKPPSQCGSLTPSMLMGKELISQIAGCGEIELRFDTPSKQAQVTS